MRHLLAAGLLLVAAAAVASGEHAALRAPPAATFSIVAIDPANGDLGVAVASRYFSVGSVVPWALAGVGAVTTQANVNVGYGPRGIDLLREGLTAKQVLEKLLAEDKFEGKDGRQVAIVDAKGGIAAFTGPAAQKWAGDRQGKTWSAQGNILAGPQVVEAMGRDFEATLGELAEKLYAALRAGDAAGGDSRGKQSAAVLVVRKQGGRNLNNDRYVYINVDDNSEPLVELRRLLDLNLAYVYEDAAERHIAAGKPRDALGAARKAVSYAPDHVRAHLMAGFLEYIAGNKTAALTEFQAAKRLSRNFQRAFDSAAASSPLFKPLLEDKEFLAKLDMSE